VTPTGTEHIVTPEQEAELRTIARDTYKKARIRRPHLPDPDSDEGQRKIERLFDITAKHLRESA
jgi:hypothetical protein